MRANIYRIAENSDPYAVPNTGSLLPVPLLAGNRLLQNTQGLITTRTFNAANEMLTIVGSSGVITTRSYDAVGNLGLSNTGGALTTFTWNGDNRLLSCIQPSLTESYTYRDDGLRASKTSAGSLRGGNLDLVLSLPSLRSAQARLIGLICLSRKRRGAWDEQNMAIATDGSFNQLERQTDAGNNLLARNTNNPGDRASGDEHRASPLAALRRPGAVGHRLQTVRPNGYIWGSLVYQLQDGYFTAPLFDAQGTTRWQFSFQGTSFYVTQLNYDAFGNLVSIPPAQPDPLRYIGQYGYYTDATGFVYVRNRYYDPVNGIWISRDPIGFGGGDWNTRRYVGNEPVGTMDPTGEKVWICYAYILEVPAHTFISTQRCHAWGAHNNLWTWIPRKEDDYLKRGWPGSGGTAPGWAPFPVACYELQNIGPYAEKSLCDCIFSINLGGTIDKIGRHGIYTCKSYIGDLLDCMCQKEAKRKNEQLPADWFWNGESCERYVQLPEPNIY